MRKIIRTITMLLLVAAIITSTFAVASANSRQSMNFVNATHGNYFSMDLERFEAASIRIIGGAIWDGGHLAPAIIVYEGRHYTASEFFRTYVGTSDVFEWRNTFVADGTLDYYIIMTRQRISATPTLPAAPPVPGAINIFVDGILVNFDVQPIQETGRTLVPVRGIFETMGAEVQWTPATQTVTAEREGTLVVLTIGSNTALVNGQTVSMGTPIVPARLVSGRTMIPLRFISEQLGMYVHAEMGGRTIHISTDGEAQSPPSAPSALSTDNNPAPGSAAYWQQHIAATESRLGLPHDRRLTDAERAAWIAEYYELGGANWFELEVIEIVNRIRQEQGLNTLRINDSLMYGARFYAQTLVHLGERGHTAGPYGGSYGTVEAFGGSLALLGGNGGGGIHSPENTVERWMDSPGHRNTILLSSAVTIGVGAYGNHVYLVVG